MYRLYLFFISSLLYKYKEENEYGRMSVDMIVVYMF